MRVSKKPPVVVQEWVTYLQRALRVRHLANYGASDDRMVKMAAHMALLGTPNDQEVIPLYASFLSLMFAWNRMDSIDKAIKALPADREAMKRILLAAKAAELVEPLDKAKFQTDMFIEIALRVEDPVAYIEVCKRDGLNRIRAIMHPNTLDVAATKYRGIVGDLASKEHRDQLTSRIKTIS